jgi:polysaccharide export outer membrane protein
LRRDGRKGVFCPAVYCSGRIGLLLLLSIPPVFAQQQTPLAPVAPTVAPRPMSEIASETNDRISQLAQATAVRVNDYIIGSGDLLGVEVFDVPELSRDVRVNQTGYIVLPLLRTRVLAGGYTALQLQDKLTELFQSEGLVSNPEVTVSVKEEHSQPITIVGAVKNPQVIQAVRPITLLQALSQAGGVSEDAGNTVLITRAVTQVSNPEDPPDATAAPPAPQSFAIALGDALESGDPRFNVPLLGGDVVSVPRAGIIYVVGAVAHPGGFVMQNDRDRMTMMKLISLSGGPTSTAKARDAVIYRKNADTGKRDEVPVDLLKVMRAQAQDIPLQTNDILFVPDSAGKKAARRAGDIAVGLTSGLALVFAGRL